MLDILNIRARKKIFVLQYSENFSFKYHREDKKKLEGPAYVFFELYFHVK